MIETTERWPSIVAGISAIVLLSYFVLRYILGPLNVNEIYFAHTLWLTIHGRRPYLDFFSMHFPTYFAVYHFLPSTIGLNFLWIVRLSNLLVLIGYAALVRLVRPRLRLYLLPLLLTFVAVSRMIEVRTDTLGLLFFNAGWAALLLGYSRRNVLMGTVLAIAGASFSARGLGIGVGYAAALVALTVRHRDWKTASLLAALGACVGAAMLTVYLCAPLWSLTFAHAALLDTPALLAPLTPLERIASFDRLPQLALTAVALAITLIAHRRGICRDQSAVIAIATASQLLLIFLDPSPFAYVYAWAAIPALVGCSMIGEVSSFNAAKILTACSAVFAFGIAGMAAAYPLMRGHPAPVGSSYRVLPDRPVNPEWLRHLSTRALLRLMIARTGQQSLENQIEIRSEVCRRFRGSVLSAWQTHPICMNDASYYWYSLKWPDISEGAPPVAGWFAEIFRQRPPDLLIFATPGDSRGLSGEMKKLLAAYDIDPAGFAMRRDTSGTSPSQRNSAHR